MKTSIKWVVLALCVAAGPVQAQTTPVVAAPTTHMAHTPAAAATAAVPADATPVPAQTPPSDMAQRLELSRKINDLTPINTQIEAGVDRAAQRIPATKREAFKARVLAAIDDKKLEESSIQAMAQTFTLPELQRMYEYFSTPEAHAIAEKWPIYHQLVQPEIVRMMDKAMMEARTGGPGETLQTPVAAPGSAPTLTYPHSLPTKTPAH